MRIVDFFSFVVVMAFSVYSKAHGLDESWIRVRLFENLKSLQIHGKGIELVNKAASLKNVSTSGNDWRTVDIQFNKKWGRGLLFLKTDRASVELKSNSIFLKGEELKIGSQTTNDFLQIYKRERGFDVIAYVKLRDYLRGVVSSEVPVAWPEETLKAQIVAARSYVVYMAEQRKNLPFDVESSIKDQVYAPTQVNRLDPLLKDTENMVLFDENKNVFKAYYHSECGGQTSSAKKVFGDTQFDAEVRDPYCRGRVWKLQLSKHEIQKSLGAFKGIVNSFNPIRRAYTVTIEKPDHTFEDWNAQKLRMKLGSTRLKSTWFESRVFSDRVEFVGKGYGHGVGLCQWGSRQMGLMKKNFREILSFYYPGTQLKAVPSGRLI